jgi:hypothetical protein
MNDNIDPGPETCCLYGDHFADEGLLTPIHECPSPAPTQWEALKDEMGTW